MKAASLAFISFLPSVLGAVVHDKRSGFKDGQPISDNGKGAPLLGGTNKALDLQNPDNLGQPSTDNGFVPNLKWSFSDSKTRLFPGGWVREQVIQDLPQSHDISGAQQHLKKGAIRELHWHRVAEWGFLYSGSLLLSGVDENGQFTTEKLEEGDIWYFPKGVAHNVQGLDDENEYLLVFDDGDFEKVGTTFMVDDWITHTPRDILAKNFGVDPSVFDKVPEKFPYILNGTVSEEANETPKGTLTGNSSYVYHTYKHPSEPVPGSGGTFRKIDSKNFPVSQTIAAALVELEPKGLRELHWHPNAEEWLYFHQGNARATVFLGDSKARTFDFTAGDTAVFPDNSDLKPGHYIENTSETEKLVWIEIYKSDRVADISLAQWLALTPADVVATTLKVDIEVVKQIKKEKQVLVKGK
ncbi:RmlC-like cupin domain-containing protein [Aspergillus tamarii]|uniref:RmlC-like cupin domain-containing protein n=1 Tax=Aspergillus tamarii TaxID=41984 RepID=A0A5N6VAS2_ASPTM|nr:RmlC-like cupin domain-containing protein [Aspergillus tamarii]